LLLTTNEIPSVGNAAYCSWASDSFWINYEQKKNFFQSNFDLTQNQKIYFY